MKTIRCALARLFRPTGRHRACSVAAPEPPCRDSRSARPRPQVSDPYTFDDTLPLVRPYFVAFEQRQRRRTLLFAVHYGVDLDTRNIHAQGVAA